MVVENEVKEVSWKHLKRFAGDMLNKKGKGLFKSFITLYVTINTVKIGWSAKEKQESGKFALKPKIWICAVGRGRRK